MASFARALFAWCLLVTPARAEEPLPAFIDATVEAYGGVDALKRAATVLQQGKVTSVAREGREGAMARLYSVPMRLRVEVFYGPDEGDLRVLDGARGWREGRPVNGPALEAMVLQAARLELPLSLLEHKASVKDLGRAERDGVTVRILELAVSPTLFVRAEIDVATHRLVRSLGRSTGRQPIEFVTSYSDYRKVDGVLFAFTEKNLAMGQPTGDTTFMRVQLLPEAPAGTFMP